MENKAFSKTVLTTVFIFMLSFSEHGQEHVLSSLLSYLICGKTTLLVVSGIKLSIRKNINCINQSFSAKVKSS